MARCGHLSHMTPPPLHHTVSAYRREIALATRRACDLWGEETLRRLCDCQGHTLKSIMNGTKTGFYAVEQARFIFCMNGFPDREEASRRRLEYHPSRIAVTSGARTPSQTKES